MITANYFDGRHAVLKQVTLELCTAGIALSGIGLYKSFSIADCKMEEPLAAAPCWLSFADGSHCEVHGHEQQAALLQYLDYRQSRIERWQERWQGALFAVIVMAAMLFSAYRWGTPWVADKLASMLPLSVERTLGSEVLKALDKTMLEPSKLSDAHIAQAEQLLRQLLPPQARMPIRLEVRRAKGLGPNAFALPNGVIVLTDAMVELIVGYGGNELSGYLADELAGVLAHELGHIQNRHSMKKILNNSLVTVLMGSLVGDFSAVVSVTPQVLVQSEYSRAMESEADAYAVNLLRAHGISPSHLADVFEALEREGKKRNSGVVLPSWLQTATEYVSSHPPTPERIARFRQAAEQ